MQIIRVFPRRTAATPIDDLAYVGEPDLFAQADAIEVSVSFSWDLPAAEQLARSWERVASVTIGGPATGQAGGDFVVGKYLKPGYVITSRGCPNRCWFCEVWRREGQLLELPIQPGWIVQDDNLLACSEPHIRNVFRMLAEQHVRTRFTGGLEAARLADWHVDLLAGLRPRPTMFFAYDTSDDFEPLVLAARKVFAAGFTKASHQVRCYVLIGYPGDRQEDAEKRLASILKLGYTPAAMLWSNRLGRQTDPAWRALHRQWTRPAIIHARKVRSAGTSSVRELRSCGLVEGGE